MGPFCKYIFEDGHLVIDKNETKHFSCTWSCKQTHKTAKLFYVKNFPLYGKAWAKATRLHAKYFI